MSSNIQIKRICQQCGKEFIARTTVTRYCSDTCSKKAYKERKRKEKIRSSYKTVRNMKVKSIEELKVKEFLTVRDVSVLINCSVRTVYTLIKNKKLKAVNLGQRMTRIKRFDLDKLFNCNQNIIEKANITKQIKQLNIANCYTISDVLRKFNISEKTLQQLIKRNSILKIEIGRNTYVSKNEIHKYLK